jgi:Uma2 family endonuclease
MVSPILTHTTAAEFDALLDRPENADKILELIAGEVVEVPSNPASSKYSSRISGYLFVYLLQNDIAHLTGEAGSYWVSGERYAPDVAVLLKARQPELADHGYTPIAPDLAVEIDYPPSVGSRRNLSLKLVNYLNAGTTVWVVLPEHKQVEVYVPGESPRVLNESDTLSLPDILPGFSLPVATIFNA